MGRLPMSHEERARRVQVVLDLRRKGNNQREIAAVLGMSQPNLSAFELANGLRLDRFKKNATQRAKLRARDWGVETADPSTLTPEELDRAKTLGFTPGRWAWLKLCPRGGNATGWRGGAAIG